MWDTQAQEGTWCCAGCSEQHIGSSVLVISSTQGKIQWDGAEVCCAAQNTRPCRAGECFRCCLKQLRCIAIPCVPSVTLGHIPGMLQRGRMGRKGLGSPLNTLLHKSTTPWLQCESSELQSRNSLLLIQIKLEISQPEPGSWKRHSCLSQTQHSGQSLPTLVFPLPAHIT